MKNSCELQIEAGCRQIAAPCLIILLLALSGPHPAHGQNAVQAWVQRFSGTTASAMAVDGSGNVFVTGAIFFGMHDNEGVITYDFDYATIKYSGVGGQLWQKYYGGPDYDGASAMTRDGSGNVIVTGYSVGSGPYYDYATVKYSGEGVQMWDNRYDSGGNDEAYAVAVDGSGNVLVTGTSGFSGAYDYVTIKYSSAGVPLWTNRYNGPGNGDDHPHAIAVDSSGNVFVTGFSVGNGSSIDYATIKYSGAGLALWTNRYNGPGNGGDDSGDIAVDSSGDVFVTGTSVGSGSSNDLATIKYSGAGVALWTNRYNGSGNGDDRASAVATDASGNVFVAGYSAGSGSGYDLATIKYSGAGVALWTNRYNGPANSDEYGGAVAVDGSGNVIVAGYSASTNVSPYNYDLATIKYSGTGAALWTNRYAGPGNTDDYAGAMAVNGSGDVFVAGSLFDGSNYDLATIKYSSAVPPLLTIARTTTNTVAISWPSPSTGFTLQQNTNNIATPNWSNVLTTPTDNGTTKTVVVIPQTGDLFFRLFKP